jgi:precorrin-2 dehydrogenase/sirohydrochlorin ferrochelatase
MKTFPIMLSVGGLKAVVVGGGAVGLRKVRALLQAGAEVTLVEPGKGDSHPFSEQQRKAGTVPVRPKKGDSHPFSPKRRKRVTVPYAVPYVIRARYKPSHLRGARLVMACTNDRDLNRRIAADARSAGALVNAADQPEDCDFYLPAVVADGDVIVAIGTGGSAPALAGSLKRAMAAALPRKVGSFARALSSLRERLKSEIADPRRRMAILKKLSRPAGYRQFLAGGAKALRKLAEKN